MDIEQLISTVIGLAIKIHSTIGPGCFEKVYEEILYYELQKIGITVHRQQLLPIHYDELYIENAYRLDLLVENKLVIELKCVHPMHPVFFKQVKTHLSLLNLKNGMILNFKTDLMKDGIHRVFNNGGADSL
jgi:GxxExxY protein